MPYDDEFQQATAREMFEELTVEELKPLASLVGGGVTKKGELVDLLVKTVGDREELRRLYDGLSATGQKAVQEAAHHPEGLLDLFKFQAKYNASIDFGGEHRGRGRSKRKLTPLCLLFPRAPILPRDVQEILLGFVPEPPPLEVASRDELPPKARRGLGRSGYLDTEEVDADDDEAEPLRVRQTARVAMHDVKAVLRFIDLGEVQVGEKTRKPSLKVQKAIGEVLADGDYYSEADQSRGTANPDLDLRIQTFAWPILVQAAGLAEVVRGTRLELTAAGRKAMTMPPQEVIRKIWERWQKTTLIDEFHRISVIKGQQSKGRVLTAVPRRRASIVELLRECPARKWISITELWRLLKASARDLNVVVDPWKLYICQQPYGCLGDNPSSWEMVEGRYVLAFLFEYAATLGLLDVAYLTPEGVRDDFSRHWGTDDLSCLSRYDGLLYVRINELGAWCLGLAKDYVPVVAARESLLRVLANRDVVAAGQPIASADVLFLERFAERKSEALWTLDPGKILESVGKGLTVEELKEFLEANNQGPLPQTVIVFLADLAKKLGQLEDLGAARLIECKDANVAQLLVHDRRLRNLCRIVGERQIVFRAVDESSVRRALKELGYVLPPPR